ncbi:hypothetical protein V2J09_011937, partial [Rumex salicifolius]
PNNIVGLDIGPYWSCLLTVNTTALKLALISPPSFSHQVSSHNSRVTPTGAFDSTVVGAGVFFMATHTHIDDDDDVFGGDFAGASSTKHSGNKRSFDELDDDEDDIFRPKKLEEAAPGVATGMILSLRESLQKYKEDLAKFETELGAAKSEIQKWHSSFQNESFIPTGNSTEPRWVVNYIQNLRSSEESLKEQLEKAKKKEAAFIVTFAKREQEIADLKAAVRELRVQLKPPSMQARKLLLDPAIHEEFRSLKNLVEEKEKKVKELHDNVVALSFSTHSKMGRMLMAKCKTLQEENEEIGHQASEGKIHELGIKLAIQKSQNAEIRTQFEGLCKHVDGLTNDIEKSNETALLLQEKLEEKDSEVKRLKLELQQKHSMQKEEENADPDSSKDIKMETDESAEKEDVKIEQAVSMKTGRTSFFDSDSEEDDDFLSFSREKFTDGFGIQPGPSTGSSLQPSFGTWNSSFKDHGNSAKVHRNRRYDGISLIANINKIINDNEKSILHAVEAASANVTQLESRIHNLENSMDDLKVCFEYNHGRTSGKLKEMECILKEIAETELRLLKLQHETEKNNDVQTTFPYQKPYLQTCNKSHQQVLDPYTFARPVCLVSRPYANLPHLNNPPPQELVVPLSYESFYSNLAPEMLHSNPPRSQYTNCQQFGSYAESGSGQEQSILNQSNDSHLKPWLYPSHELLPRASFLDTDDKPLHEDIVEEVIAMGFRRDKVIVEVKKMKQTQESVDLNTLLDKLMKKDEFFLTQLFSQLEGFSELIFDLSNL